MVREILCFCVLLLKFERENPSLVAFIWQHNNHLGDALDGGFVRPVSENQHFVLMAMLIGLLRPRPPGLTGSASTSRTCFSGGAWLVIAGINHRLYIPLLKGNI